jgi:hypothetical protein
VGKRTHATAGGRRDTSNKANNRLGLVTVLSPPSSSLLLSLTTNLSNHDNACAYIPKYEDHEQLRHVTTLPRNCNAVTYRYTEELQQHQHASTPSV